MTTRLLLAFAALRPGLTTIDGHISMQKRPNKALVDALRRLGARHESTQRRLPADARHRHARICAGPCGCPSNISSQYLTSLLIIAPLLDGGLTIEVEGELTSKPYVDLTLDEMAKFGVRVDNHDYRRLTVAPQTYRAREHRRGGRRLGGVLFRGAGDAARRPHHAQNLGTRTRQGDYAFFGLCEKLGARVERAAATHRSSRGRASSTAASTATST